MRSSPHEHTRALTALAAAMILMASAPLAAQTFAPPPDQPARPQAAPSGQGPAVSQAQGGAGVMLTDPFSGLQANKTYTGERISLDFQNADIHNILRLIGEVSGKNVVVSDTVSGKVTLKLKNVPWDQALDIVLASKNLGMVENGNVIRIDSMDAIRRATPDLSDPATRVPLGKKMFTPKYSSVASLAAEMEKAKSIRGSVRVIGNDIYVEDDFVTLEAISEVFRRNDRVTKQILIEARIVQADSTFVQNIGVNWGAQYDHISHGRAPYVAENAQTLMGSRWNVAGTENSGDISPNSGPNSYNPGELFGAMSVTGGAASLGAGFLNRAGSLMLNAELTAMEHSSNTRIISAPRIMASNDQEVYIKQGDQIPISNPATATASATTELVDAAMELRVTPHIEENGEIITLDITITKNEVGDTFGENTGLKTNEAGTKLMVRNGETVVIGGIIVDRQINTSDHVPGLHSIPLLGWLFKSDGVNNTKQELLIFLTANIIPITV